MPNPQQTFKGEDGKDYIDVPGMTPIAMEDLQPPTSPSFGSKALGMAKAASPEIVAALSTMLAPETGFASLAIPPAAAAATEAVKQWSDTGSASPMSVAIRGGLNAIPGIAGKVFGRMSAPVLSSAADASAQSGNFLGGGLKAAASILRGDGAAAMPETQQVINLQQKLSTLGNNPQARMAVERALKAIQANANTAQVAARSGTISQTLRALLGLGIAAGGQ